MLGHVRRLETSAESAVQMHFSALGSRTNDIMRTLTVLTAIFLPLNLITGVFGAGTSTTCPDPRQRRLLGGDGMMVLVVATLVWWFRRKRYIDD